MTMATGIFFPAGTYFSRNTMARWLVKVASPVRILWLWIMKRYIPQFVHPVSGSFVMTQSQVPKYLPPSPSWIRGTGNLKRSTSSPFMMFSLQGPVGTITGLTGFCSRASYSR